MKATQARGVLHFVLFATRGASGRLAFSTLCIAIGVAAVVAVAGLSGALEQGLASQSRELLGADMAVRSYRPLPEELDRALEKVAPGAQRLDVRELATMAAALDRDDRDSIGGETAQVRASRLCELKVVARGFPFYGQLELEPAGTLDEFLNADSVVVAPELLAALDLELGDVVRIGGGDFRIVASVLAEPDRIEFQMTLGPRVFLSPEGLERTALLGVGNRVQYRALLRIAGTGARQELEGIEKQLREELAESDYLRFESHFEAQPGVQRGLERFTSYLGLVALLSLILGGIGVAQVTRGWMATRTTDIAVWKTLGLLPREILLLFLVHGLLFAGLGCAVGAVLGGSVPWLVPRFLPDLLPARLILEWQPMAMVRGVGLGLAVATLFLLLPLCAVWQVPTARVLRSNVEALPAPRVVRWGALALLGGGLWTSAWIQGGEVRLASAFTGGLAGTVLALYIGARVLAWLAGRVPRHRLWPGLAHGIAQLARPGSASIGAISALGLGTTVVAAISMIEGRMVEELEGALPKDAPSVFLVDVQPDQWPWVQELLTEADATSIDSVPVVMARLAAVDGVSVAELKKREESGGRGRWSLTREQRLTWFDALPDSNRLVAGELWNDPAPNEVSLEEGYAEGLGVGIGAQLTFDVQGIPLSFLVTSLRSVEWESFAINFFLAVEPGPLEKAPQMRLAAARLPAANEDGLQDRLVEAAPNVTLIRLRPIIEKVSQLLGRIALGVRWLGSFTIVAGLAILAGAVAASQLERGREVALLKTLGITRLEITLLFVSEFALAGATAGCLGVCAAYGLTYGFALQVLELPAELSIGPWFVAVLGAAALSVLAGLAASLRALAVRPIASLRGA